MGQWSHSDLSELANAPMCGSGNEDLPRPMGCVRSVSVNTVVFTGRDDHHIHQLHLTQNTSTGKRNGSSDVGDDLASKLRTARQGFLCRLHRPQQWRYPRVATCRRCGVTCPLSLERRDPTASALRRISFERMALPS
jgi:hypothetical protein